MSDELEVIPPAQSHKGIEPETVQQTGEKNTYIHHADVVNVHINKNIDSQNDSQSEHYYRDSILSRNDAALLKELKGRYITLTPLCGKNMQQLNLR